MPIHFLHECVYDVSDTLLSVISLSVCLQAHQALHHAAPACVLSGISTIDLSEHLSCTPVHQCRPTSLLICLHSTSLYRYSPSTRVWWVQIIKSMNATECSFLCKLWWKMSLIFFISVCVCVYIYIYVYIYIFTIIKICKYINIIFLWFFF